ncbi:DUF1566 domain-containing protein [Vibrio cholerae]|uniref:Lcl domain-containing protein n=1 Tax=Vibrio cholerae TaxID=666 RepID=UPI001964679B|nr:DUF1566 domain-containing protein [Vibrio cholerae]EIF2259185.1 DUF1566 domain-containing protein [Vibrio cholerae]EJL6336042.1 DUF1566 domain-containing protein [Vibrio cholerae]EJL6549165.1 DUF1566 domain-containing protein [Vibrio cholerae]EKF9573060.1 DUF1566 domain-containing protein [Vibrio cholerae]ELB8601938.1 DUF1566 domain-containing protein [Vibrio cholerae]
MFKFDKGFVPCILGSLLLFLLSGCGEDSVETSGSGSNTSVVGDSAASGTQNDADTLSIVKDIRLSKGPSSVLLDWDAVDGATSYHVYYARESGIEPDSYASKVDGTWLQNVQPPVRISNLTPHVWHLVVTAVHPAGESAPSGEISAFAATQPLNDTGIDWCADGNQNNLDCPVQGYEGQDGEHGRDAQALAGKLPKVGAGTAGFDFTKLDASGEELPASASEWSCVRDNVSGLIWEVKQPAGSAGLRDANHTYSWYNPDNSTNGGNAGTQNGGTCQGSACDTQAFVNAVNSQGLCGANDWRLPSVNELLSIVHNGRVEPAIDQSYFPHTPQYNWYCSSSPHAYDSNDAWGVNFDDGRVYYGNKNFGVPVRLVRAGQ